MGTTADKLNYLTETKNAIKTAITAKGGTVNDAMPFREYANAIMGIPQEGGSDGGSGIIDVTELPTENIDENAVYRVTESYKATVDDLILVVPDEETGETLVQQSLFEMFGEALKLYVVDELPADMKVTDLENGEESYVYLLRTDGIGYINALQFGAVLPIGVLLIGEEGFDKGITDNVYAETEMGVYSTFESYEQFIRWFVRENGEWKEITAHFYETFLNGSANVSSLSGVYTEGEDIVVTQNGATVNIKDLILKDKVIPIVKVDTPYISNLISGNFYELNEDWFRMEDGEYYNSIRPYCFANTDIENATIPSFVLFVGTYCFLDCARLKAVTFKGLPQVIHHGVFENCRDLTTINVPWSEGEVAYAPWGATNATINYNYTEG